jgi:ribulose-phosphate 3-epimerase
MKIIPAILTDSFGTLQQQVDAVKYSPLIEAVHVDIIDGSFVDNTTVTPLDLTVGDFDPIKLDFHLMAEEPMDFVYECEAVKDYLPIRRIYGQVERMSHQEDFLWAVKANNWEAGLALDLFTPLDAIEAEIWPNLQHLLLMGVEAGAQSQTFHNVVLEKLQEVKQLTKGLRQLQIVVDGGIKLENAVKVMASGADELIVGSAIWQNQNPLQVLEEFTQLT